MNGMHIGIPVAPHVLRVHKKANTYTIHHAFPPRAVTAVHFGCGGNQLSWWHEQRIACP